jgi:sugar (pentulose or hexulose) kinase
MVKSSGRLLLGADLGTTAVKVTLFDEKGRTAASATEEYALCTPAPQHVELDPEVYWKAFSRSLGVVMGASGVSPADIVSLGISAQGETLLAVDGTGRPLRPAIVWMDNRAQAESEELARVLGNDRVHDVTGQVCMLPMWPAAKVLWLRRHEQDVFRRAARFLLLEDWFVHRLAGPFVAEGSLLCSTTWWDLRTKRYWPDMLAALGIGEERLPEVVEPGQAIGPLLPEAAAELGLDPRTIVATGALDQACGAIGVGNVRPGIFSACTGSNVTVVAVVDRPTIDPNRQLPCFYFGLPDTYMMHAFSMTGGMVLRWFRDQFGREEMAHGGDGYERLARAAGAVAPGAEGLVLLPHFQGAGPPESNPDARGVLYGLALHHTKAHVTRAILESIAMIVHRMIDAVRAMGIEVQEIRCLGGGAKSGVWNQIMADVNRLPVTTMKNTGDAACLGAAVLAGTAAGVWPSVAEALGCIVEHEGRFQPDPATAGAYSELYGTYCRLYDALLPVFARTVTSRSG